MKYNQIKLSLSDEAVLRLEELKVITGEKTRSKAVEKFLKYGRM